MRIGGFILAAINFAASSAMAEELNWRVGGEFGFEFATGLGYDHDDAFATPPLRVQDYRYALEAFVGAGYETTHYDFDLHYRFDQRTYEEYNVLHRERQEVTATATTILLPGTEFSLRYRFRRSQPQGQLGTIDYNQLRGRLRLPAMGANRLNLDMQPYVMGEWNSGDFKKRDGLDGTGWSVTGGIVLNPTTPSWSTDLSVVYGDREAQFFFFTYNFVDTSASFETSLGPWARWIAMETASAEFQLTYREEWYDGTLADDGGHRHDREFGASFDLMRPMTEHLSFIGTFEIEEHQSNWGSQDFLETRTILGFQAAF